MSTSRSRTRSRSHHRNSRLASRSNSRNRSRKRTSSNGRTKRKSASPKRHGKETERRATDKINGNGRDGSQSNRSLHDDASLKKSNTRKRRRSFSTSSSSLESDATSTPVKKDKNTRSPDKQDRKLAGAKFPSRNASPRKTASGINQAKNSKDEKAAKSSNRPSRRDSSASSDSDSSQSSSESSSSSSHPSTARKVSRTNKEDSGRHGRKNEQKADTTKKGNDSGASDSAQNDLKNAKPARASNIFLNDPRAGRTGGVYIPPFKLAQLRQEQHPDKTSQEYQRMTWDALRKSLNGLINKVNVSNTANIIPELFQENLVRGRGILTRSIMKAQLASPGFTHIYAALVAVLNTKMPENGELLIKRVVYRFRRSFQRGDKVVAIALVRFIAHLVNQQIVHELLALEILTLLLASPTDDSVEVAVNFTKECGQILAELCPEGLRAIFERFRGILHEGDIDKRVQYTIEGLFAIRKGGFADYPAVHEQLDLVESGDQITHEIGLEDEIDPEDRLDVFRFDPDYEKNEAMWTEIKNEILGESDSENDQASSGDESDHAGEANEQEQQNSQQNAIQDCTEQDLVNLRRTIYLTIMSSVGHEECAHKLLKIQIRSGQEKEICSMLIECCSQERTYLRYYGLLGQRFCLIKREYQDAFDECFMEQYSLIHRLETNKLRNVAKFFAHLLFTDALPWTILEYIRLNEEETTSSSRIFIKMLCQELAEHMGMKTLKERLTDEYMQETFAGLFPKDHPRNTRFAINFFTSIGLGGLTTELREFLKNAPKLIMNNTSKNESRTSSSDDSSSSGSDTDSSSSNSDTSSNSDSSSDSSDSSDSD